MPDRTCSIDGCEGKHRARGWCAFHYKRWARFGDPLAVPEFRNKGKICTECDRPAVKLGMCNLHYERARNVGRLCSIAGCGRGLRSRGWCSRHYERWLKYGSPTGQRELRNKGKTCLVAGCSKPSKSLGYCVMHYERQRRTGDPGGPNPTRTGPRPCAVSGCVKLTGLVGTARGLCYSHYRRWRRFGDPQHEVPSVNKGKTCRVEDCTSPAFTDGLCSMHDARKRRTGTTDPPASFRQLNAPQGQAWCSKCRSYKPCDAFNRNRSTSNGLYAYCRSCDSQIKAARKAAARPDSWLDRRSYQYRARALGVQSERYTPREIADRDGWRCRLCGRPIRRDLKWPHPLSLTMDHIVPLKPAEGGTPGLDVRSNVQAAHSSCNISKGNRGSGQLMLFG